MSEEAEAKIKPFRTVASESNRAPTPAIEGEIEIGDVVLLNSDPVHMTVIGIVNKKDEKLIKTSWFDLDGGLCEGSFDPRCLWITRKAADKHNI